MPRFLPFLAALSMLSMLGSAHAAPAPAVLTLPAPIEIATINGVEPRKSLLGGKRPLELAPGRYEILAYYAEIWPLGDAHDSLMSDPALFVLDAQAGHRYTISYAQPDDYEAARKLAATFSGALVDETSGQRQPSQDSGLRFRRGLTGHDRTLVAAGPTPGAPQRIAPLPIPPATRPAPAPVSQQPATASDAAAQPVRDWLPMMQAWWTQATAEERRAFLAWVATQQP